MLLWKAAWLPILTPPIRNRTAICNHNEDNYCFIAGAGAVGTHLAKLLSREKQDIILMDDDEEKLSTLSSNIYQMMLDADVSNVKCLTFANADVAEFTVPENAKITKNKVKDLGLPKGTTIGGLIRNGEGILVTGDTLIQAGDHVVVFCLSMMIKKIEKYFN